MDLDTNYWLIALQFSNAQCGKSRCVFSLDGLITQKVREKYRTSFFRVEWL